MALAVVGPLVLKPVVSTGSSSFSCTTNELLNSSIDRATAIAQAKECDCQVLVEAVIVKCLRSR